MVVAIACGCGRHGFEPMPIDGGAAADAGIDAGGPGLDVDSGASADSGIDASDIDGGPMPVDAGPEPFDAGPEPFDAGMEPFDAGMEPLDSGPTPVDAGPTAADAGPTPTDAGVVPGSPRSCREILDAMPGAADGDYLVELAGLGATTLSCDMTTDGGGWTLILNYAHQAGTTPAPVARSTSFPRLGSTTFGADGSSDPASWGHARPSLAALVPFTELRFYCRSSLHTRTLHFATTSSRFVSYVRTGTGWWSDLGSTVRLLPDHTAMLPLASTHVTGDAGDSALTMKPFYDAGSLEWLIDAAEWECDGSTAARASTAHRVWVR